MSDTTSRAIFMHGGDYAVLALHGLRSTPLELKPVLKKLHLAGFTVDTPHMTGYGFSENPETGRWREWLDEALARFDFLASRYSQVAVCGLSMGATLALAVAAERKQAVSAVGALSTTLYYDGWNTPWYRFLSPLGYFTPLRYYMHIHETSPFGIKNERLREWIGGQVAAGPLSLVGASSLSLPALHEAERLMRHTRRQLSKIVSPTIMLHSSNDDIASLKGPRMVKRLADAQDVRLVELHDSYHMITLDNERDHVAALVVNFFTAQSVAVSMPTVSDDD